jgi:hypothetical protein
MMLCAIDLDRRHHHHVHSIVFHVKQDDSNFDFESFLKNMERRGFQDPKVEITKIKGVAARGKVLCAAIFSKFLP